MPTQILTVALVLLLWEGVSRLGLISPIILPPPSAVVSAARTSAADYAEAFGVTAAEILTASAIAWTAGVGIGFLAGAVSLIGSAFGPILVSLFAIPLITWYPLFMTWFGIGSPSKVAYAVVSGFFPIAIAAMNGVRGIDRAPLTLARAIGCTPWQTVWHVMLPFALPAIVSGLRIGTGLTVIGVVVTEMLASTAGLGYLISYNRTMFNTGDVYLGILLTLAIAYLVNLALDQVERRFAGWRDLQR